MPKGDINLPLEKGQHRDPRLPKKAPAVDYAKTGKQLKSGWSGLKALVNRSARGGKR